MMRIMTGALPRSSSSDFEQSELEVVRRSSLKTRYELTGHLIYRGLGSTIFLAMERGTFVQVGVKVIQKHRLDAQELRMALAEVDIHSSVPPHPNVVGVMGSETVGEAILLATPYAQHGDLWSLIQYGKTYCEIEVRNCLAQMVASLRHVHNFGIVHGDVKPQNYLLYLVDGRYCAKLCDFGLADRPCPATGMVPFRGVRGTSGWFAPEMLAHEDYSYVMDLFACGLIAFRMLGGYPAFDPPSRFQDAVEFDESCWCHVSQGARGFIQRLLTLEPTNRGTAQSASEHEWIAGPPPPQPTARQLESLSAFGPPPCQDVMFWSTCLIPEPHRCISYGNLRSLVGGGVDGDGDEPMAG